MFVYAAGGYYYPGQGPSTALRDEMRGYLDRGYTVVKMKIGGASLDEDLRRIEAVLKVLQARPQLAVDANGRFDLETAIAYAKMLRDYDCSGTRRPATRSTSSCRPRWRELLRRPDGDRREPVLPCRTRAT